MFEASNLLHKHPLHIHIPIILVIMSTKDYMQYLIVTLITMDMEYPILVYIRIFIPQLEFVIVPKIE